MKFKAGFLGIKRFDFENFRNKVLHEDTKQFFYKIFLLIFCFAFANVTANVDRSMMSHVKR